VAPLPLNQPTYVALTYDPLAGMSQLFVNGLLVNSFSGSLNPLNRFADYNNYLGRSQWVDDPFFKGQWDEFRIWEGILSFQQITNHFAAGPDQSLPGMRPCLTIVCAGANVLLSWPTNGTENFKLMGAATMPATNWTAVICPVIVTNALYQATVPATGTAMFYRLKQ
ncbi:MAG TPA: LamG-like jellyroll fold domain-containing protein, partial [Bacillota bacterium]|nr:LamG-like jellyroll fold domain-containing protein [Bacillota bacterium]